MGYPIPELLVESVIRNKLISFRNNPENIIRDVFSFLLSSNLDKKYGEAELSKIKKIFTGREIHIHHATHLAMAEDMAISIEFLHDSPSQDFLSGFTSREEESITPATIVNPVIPTSYDSQSGILYINSSIDLSSVTQNQIYVDVAGNEFIINSVGENDIIIERDSDIDITGNGYIKSSIDFVQYERRGRMQKVSVGVAAHSKDPLTTKYLYALLKNFLDSSMDDLLEMGIENPVITGVNFQQNPEYQGDFSYAKALEVSGTIEESWKMDEDTVIESVDLDLRVPKDVAGNVELKRTDQTVKVTD